jgi:hypothetical protein
MTPAAVLVVLVLLLVQCDTPRPPKTSPPALGQAGLLK